MSAACPSESTARPEALWALGRGTSFLTPGQAHTPRVVLCVGSLADKAGLVMLVLAAGSLLLRPADLLASLAGWDIYKHLMLVCLLLSLGRVLRQMSPIALKANAITALVLLLVPAVMLSHLAHLDTYSARFGVLEMAKACVFFLLVVGIVDSVGKIRVMLAAAATAVLAVTLLAIAQHHGVLHVSALAGVVQRASDNAGADLLRLCGIGVFNDPNDFSLMIVLGMVVCLYGLGERSIGPVRWMLLGALAVFGYALLLTHSRGGLMSALAAFMVLGVAKLGWRNALPMGCVIALLLLLPFWGRQTNLNLADPEDTFQSRIYLWGQSMDLFRSWPLFGVGQGKVVDITEHVTHNSFLQAFAEMGVLGGIAFVGAFYLLVRGLWNARPVESEASRLRPYVVAIVVGYATGLLSLSRCYTVPTQFVLSLGTAYLMVVAGVDGVAMPRLDWACVRRVTGVGAVFLAAVYVFIRIMMMQTAA